MDDDRYPGGRRFVPEPRGEWLVPLIAASIAVAVALGWKLVL